MYRSGTVSVVPQGFTHHYAQPNKTGSPGHVIALSHFVFLWLVVINVSAERYETTNDNYKIAVPKVNSGKRSGHGRVENKLCSIYIVE